MLSAASLVKSSLKVTVHKIELGRCSELLAIKFRLTAFISNTRSRLHYSCLDACAKQHFTGNEVESMDRYQQAELWEPFLLRAAGDTWTLWLHPAVHSSPRSLPGLYKREEPQHKPQELCRIQLGEDKTVARGDDDRQLLVLPASVCIVMTPVNLQHTGCRMFEGSREKLHRHDDEVLQTKKKNTCCRGTLVLCSERMSFTLKRSLRYERMIHMRGFFAEVFHDGAQSDAYPLQQQP